MLLMFQSSLSFGEMAGTSSKSKVTDVHDSFGLAYTMSIGDLFDKKAKKNSRKARDPSKERGAQRHE